MAGLLLSCALFGQKLIQDTLLLDLKIPAQSTYNIDISTVRDSRDVSDFHVVAVDEVKKYNFIPVDQLICVRQPLGQMVTGLFSTHAGAPGLEIRNLDLSEQTCFIFFKQSRLRARVFIGPVSETGALSPHGDIVFDIGANRFFPGGSLKSGYERVLDDWFSRLPRDIASVRHALNGDAPLPYHFRPHGQDNPWMQLRAGSDLIATNRGFLVDAQLGFAYPEASRMFRRYPGLLRYRHQKKFESIEWGILNGDVRYRLNRFWLSGCRFNLLLGINRWKNMKTVDHQLYDAVIGDLSLIQSIYYHPRNARTLTFGFGFYQSLYYVYSEKLNFEAGITFHTGLQL